MLYFTLIFIVCAVVAPFHESLNVFHRRKAKSTQISSLKLLPLKAEDYSEIIRHLYPNTTLSDKIMRNLDFRKRKDSWSADEFRRKKRRRFDENADMNERILKWSSLANREKRSLRYKEPLGSSNLIDYKKGIRKHRQEKLATNYVKLKKYRRYCRDKFQRKSKEDESSTKTTKTTNTCATKESAENIDQVEPLENRKLNDESLNDTYESVFAQKMKEFRERNKFNRTKFAENLKRLQEANESENYTKTINEFYKNLHPQVGRNFNEESAYYENAKPNKERDPDYPNLESSAFSDCALIKGQPYGLPNGKYLTPDRYLTIRHSLRNYLTRTNSWSRGNVTRSRRQDEPKKHAPLMCIPYVKEAQDKTIKQLIKKLQRMLGKKHRHLTTTTTERVDIFGQIKYKPEKRKKSGNKFKKKKKAKTTTESEENEEGKSSTTATTAFLSSPTSELSPPGLSSVSAPESSTGSTTSSSAVTPRPPEQIPAFSLPPMNSLPEWSTPTEVTFQSWPTTPSPADDKQESIIYCPDKTKNNENFNIREPETTFYIPQFQNSEPDLWKSLMPPDDPQNPRDTKPSPAETLCDYDILVKNANIPKYPSTRNKRAENSGTACENSPQNTTNSAENTKNETTTTEALQSTNTTESATETQSLNETTSARSSTTNTTVKEVESEGVQAPVTFKGAALVKRPEWMGNRPVPKICPKIYPDSMATDGDNDTNTNTNTNTNTSSNISGNSDVRYDNDESSIANSGTTDARLPAVSEDHLKVTKQTKARNDSSDEETDVDSIRYRERILSENFDVPEGAAKSQKSAESDKKRRQVRFPKEKRLRNKILVDVLKSPIYERQLSGFEKRKKKEKMRRLNEDVHLAEISRKRALSSWLRGSRKDLFKPDAFQETAYVNDADEIEAFNLREKGKQMPANNMQKTKETTTEKKESVSVYPIYASRYGYDSGGEMKKMEIIWKRFDEKKNRKEIIKNVTVLAVLAGLTSPSPFNEKDIALADENGSDVDEMIENTTCNHTCCPEKSSQTNCSETDDKAVTTITAKTTAVTTITASATTTASSTTKAAKTNGRNSDLVNGTDSAKPAVDKLPITDSGAVPAEIPKPSKMAYAKDLAEESFLEFLNYAVYIIPVMFLLLFFVCCFCCVIKILARRRKKKKKRRNRRKSETTSESSASAEPTVKSRRLEKLERKLRNIENREKENGKFWNLLKFQKEKGLLEEEDKNPRNKRKFLRFLQKGIRNPDEKIEPGYPNEGSPKRNKRGNNRKIDCDGSIDLVSIDSENPGNEDRDEEGKERKELIALLKKWEKLEDQTKDYDQRSRRSVVVQYLTEDRDFRSNSIDRNVRLNDFRNMNEEMKNSSARSKKYEGMIYDLKFGSGDRSDGIFDPIRMIEDKGSPKKVTFLGDFSDDEGLTDKRMDYLPLLSPKKRIFLDDQDTGFKDTLGSKKFERLKDTGVLCKP